MFVKVKYKSASSPYANFILSNRALNPPVVQVSPTDKTVPDGVSLGKVGVGRGVEISGIGVFVGGKDVDMACGVAVTTITIGVGVGGNGEVVGGIVSVAWASTEACCCSAIVVAKASIVALS